MNIDGISREKRIIRSADYAAVVPGMIMCILTLGILVADMLCQDMDTAQYYVYPAAFRMCSVAAAACGIMCLSARILFSKSGYGVCTYILTAFAVWIMVSTAVNGFTREALNGVPYRYLGAADYIICLAGFMGCSALIRSERMRLGILEVYMVIADLVSIAALYHEVTGRISAFDNKDGLSAIFFHHNHYGYFLVMAVLVSAGFFIYGSGRTAICGAVSFLINIITTGINQTMGCILAIGAVVVIVLFMLLIQHRPVMYRAAILTVFLTVAVVAAVSASKTVRQDVTQLLFDIWSITWGGNHGLAGHRRWLLWQETIGYIKNRPVFGYGCEGIHQLLRDSTGVSSAHNEILTYATFFGIPAAVCYSAGMAGFIIRAMCSNMDRCSCRIAFMAAAGYFISSMFGVAMFYTLPFFFIFAGMCSCNKE